MFREELNSVCNYRGSVKQIDRATSPSLLEILLWKVRSCGKRQRENILILSNISFANKVKWLVSCKIWKANLDLYSDWWTVSEISPYGQMQHKNKIPKIMRTHTCREFRSFPKFLTRRKSDYRPGCPLCTDYISILISSMEQAVKTGFQGHTSNFLHFKFLSEISEFCTLCSPLFKPFVTF